MCSLSPPLSCHVFNVECAPFRIILPFFSAKKEISSVGVRAPR